MKNEELISRIRSSGTKRILALDEGGIRGMITIEVLAKIEHLLRQKPGGGTISDCRITLTLSQARAPDGFL